MSDEAFYGTLGPCLDKDGKPTFCQTCHGNGCDRQCGYCDHWRAGPRQHKQCTTCGGTGLTKRRRTLETNERNQP